MSMWQQRLIKSKPVSWLMITTILVVTLLPAHYHMHHLFSAESTSHDHTVDLHIIIDTVDQLHHDESAHSFSPASDTIVKQKIHQLFPFILLSVLLLLLPVLSKLTRHRIGPGGTFKKNSYFHRTPPLRAPPLF